MISAGFSEHPGWRTFLVAPIVLLMVVLTVSAMVSDASDADTVNCTSYYYDHIDEICSTDNTLEPDLVRSFYNALAGTEPVVGTLEVTVPTQGLVGDTLSNSQLCARTIFRLDHPEYFWINQYDNLNYIGTSGSDLVVRFSPMDYHDGITVNGAAERDAKYAAIDDIIACWDIDEADDEITKIEKINQGLVDLIRYGKDDPETCKSAARNILTAFLSSDNRVVCEGYAQSFKYCCDIFHIDCITVHGKYQGGQHAWNYVRVDGEWYHVDVTHNDGVSINNDPLRHLLQGSAAIGDDYEFGFNLPNLAAEPVSIYPVLTEQGHYVYTIRFVDYDGTVIDTQNVERGAEITKPADPEREGHTFIRWAGWGNSSYHPAKEDVTYTAVYSLPSEESPSMCGSSIALILVAALSVAAIPLIRFVRP